MTVKKRLITATPNDWASVRGEMGEDVPGSGTTDSSSTPSIAPNRGLRSVLPAFTCPVPSLPVPPPNISQPPLSPAPVPSSNPSAISRPCEEENKGGRGMTYLRPPHRARPQVPPQLVVSPLRPAEVSPPIEACATSNETNNDAQMEDQRSKKEPQEIGRSSVENKPSKDEMVSFMDEERRMTRYCKKMMSEKGITDAKMMEMMDELEGSEKARRSEFSTLSKLTSLRRRRVNEEEDEYLRTEESKMADICEALMQEQSPFTDRCIRSVKKDGATGTLLGMLIRGALEPVKVSDWADKLDYDEYYLGTYARGVCKELTQGIVKIKTENNMISSSFIIGDALTEYRELCRNVYYHELVANVINKGGIYEKDIYSTLGMSSLLAHLPIDHSSPFIVQQKADGRYITMRI